MFRPLSRIDSRHIFSFDRDRLGAIAGCLRDDYRHAHPFPHVVIDDFLPADVAEAVLQEFPGPNDIEWERSYEDTFQLKLACEDETKVGSLTRDVLHQLNSSVFVTFLEQLTGIDGLIPDPHFCGGGLHQIAPGGYLKVHADFNWYARLRLDRRLNLLLYLNRSWPAEFGGCLELWDREVTQCLKRILPVFNRCVIFSTTDYSYHGHPDPLSCPPDQTRKSLALYYYSNGRPSDEISPSHSTLFRPPPTGVSEDRVRAILRRRKLKRLVRRLLPPILMDAVDLLRQRVSSRREDEDRQDG